MMRKMLVPVLVVMLVFQAVPAMSQGRQDKAPSFSLKTHEGKTIDLGKLKGKVVVLNFWATWCGPCRQEIPGFADAYKRLHGKGVEIIGISLDEGGWDVVQPYVTKANIPYPVVIGDQTLTDAYGGITAIPTTFIVSREGKILTKHVGYLSKDELENQINSAL